MTGKNSIRNEIIQKIKRNRISTTEVADCLGKKGAIADIKPINRGHFYAGNIFLAYAYNESNWELHKQLENVGEEDIVIVETHNCNSRAIFGELVSRYVTLYRGCSAIVVNGYMRDGNILLKENYPVWCKGITPIGCFNKKNEAGLDPQIIEKWKKIYEGAIAVCDDGGVVVIPPDDINKDFLEKLDFIELQEDIWRYCINTKKWTTYETVCLKKYLDTELLPPELREPFKKFINKIEQKK